MHACFIFQENISVRFNSDFLFLHIVIFFKAQKTKFLPLFLSALFQEKSKIMTDYCLGMKAQTVL